MSFYDRKVNFAIITGVAFYFNMAFAMSKECRSDIRQNKPNVGDVYFYASPHGGFVADKIVSVRIDDVGFPIVNLHRKLLKESTLNSFDKTKFYQDVVILGGILTIYSGSPDGKFKSVLSFSKSEIEKTKSLKKNDVIAITGQKKTASPSEEKTDIVKITITFLGCNDKYRIYEISDKKKNTTIYRFNRNKSWKAEEISSLSNDDDIHFILVKKLKAE